MHVPISATTFILVSAAAPASAAVIKVLVWGGVFWMIIGAVAWANGGHLTRREDAGLVGALPGRRRADAS